MSEDKNFCYPGKEPKRTYADDSFMRLMDNRSIIEFDNETHQQRIYVDLYLTYLRLQVFAEHLNSSVNKVCKFLRMKGSIKGEFYTLTLVNYVPDINALSPYEEYIDGKVINTVSATKARIKPRKLIDPRDKTYYEDSSGKKRMKECYKPLVKRSRIKPSSTSTRLPTVSME